jgi:acyl-CoA synthetase (AMP-forming)/AMP-acid ligase II/acyl carrier protein
MSKATDASLMASLREVLYSQAALFPNAHALQAPNFHPLTYSRLFHQIEYTGHALRTLGIAHSDRVAVVLPNGPDMATAFLGIAAYATCAPLNPSYPRAQFEFYLTDLRARAIVLPADADLPAREAAEQLGLTIMELEPSSNQLAGAFTLRGVPAEFEEQNDWGKGADCALVLHTSGTTSRPKQVPLSHRNLHSSAHAIARTLALAGDDCCLNVMPLFHIHGLVGVLLSSMFSGGSVVCSEGYDEGSFAQLMSDFSPTWYSAVPTMHQSILSLANKHPPLARNNRLRLIRSSSSSLSPAVMGALEDRFRVPVIESYGMTEASHQMASNPLPPAERKPGSVGLPAGPEMAVMDDEGNLLSPGETGEIVIRGVNVTAGYANNPEANAASFTSGWFRTGDRGRTDDDGYFYITGRTKEMINRGGETIAPREIDDVLLEHSAVAQAVAFSVPHPSLGEDVAAAVVLHAANDASEQELRKFAFERLAPFKVPSRIIMVMSIPKGPTGKLQRIGLHEQLEAQLRQTYVEPRTDLERSVVAVIEQALQTSPVGATDNFFALGGDSIQATQVLADLSREFQVELPAVTLFLYPAAEDLAREITQTLAGDTGMLDELLTEIENMSDQEIQQQLE